MAHSTDFQSVLWFGEEYKFTPTQAACVRLFWEHWEQRTPVIGEQTILELVDASGGRLRDVFSKGKHPAWKTFITPAGKGAFQLAKPGNPDSQ